MNEDIFRKKIVEDISKALKQKIDPSSLEIPPNPEMGDYAFPCFPLAKVMRKKPVEIAIDIASKIKSNNLISSVRVIGAYVNFFVVKEELSKNVLKKIFREKQDYGSTKKKEFTVMIESPSPNTNKPLHLGHVRNMLLGNALINIYNTLGYNTVRVEIVNDRGVHICKSMLAYEKHGNNKKPDKKTDHFVGDYYVIYSVEEKKNPNLENEIQDMLEKWEKGDKKTVALWEKMRKWCLDGFKQTYDRYGVIMNKPNYESEIYLKGKKVVMEGLEKGLFTKDEKGNIIADLEKYNLGKKVLLRANGTAVYMTFDLFLGNVRSQEFKMDKMIYIVGNEQIHHFEVLFKIFELLNYPFAKDCYHLAYGMVYLPEGKMKSREGTVVDADNLADEMHVAAKKELVKRYPNLGEKELEKRAEEIGMGAIKFFVLKFDSMKDFTYNPKESLSFEGETGPYVQYTHARIVSILKKYGNNVIDKVDYSCLDREEEKNIIKLLEEFPTVIEKSGIEYKPSLITRHLLDLTQAFNEYYHKDKIIQGNKEIEKARILLIYCVKQVIETGLFLLGISAPDIM